MTHKIPIQKYVRAFTLVPGQTLRFNHEGCPAGADTRQRLYITRPEEGNGVYLAYCHNCGNSGFLNRYSGKGYFIRPTATQHHTKSGTDAGAYQVPTSIVKPTPEQLWDFNLPYNVLEKSLCEYADLYWNPTTNRWHLPVAKFNVLETTGWTYPDGKVGDNERANYANQYPKYKLTVPKDFPGFSLYYKRSTGAKPFDNLVVFVEDQMSAINLSRIEMKDCWVNGACLYGCNNSIEKVHQIKELYERHGTEATYVVWFDNDKPDIIEKAKDTVTYLKLLGADNPKVVTLEKSEPKRLRVERVKEELEKVLA